MYTSTNKISYKVTVMIMFFVVINLVMAFKINALNEKVTNLEKKIEYRASLDKEILKHLGILKDQQEKAQEIELRKLEEMQKHAEAINIIKTNGISANTDLVTSTVALTAADINRIIDIYTEDLEDSLLKGHGESFIIASQETGLNPIYILAHAIEETGAGTSYLAMANNNFFGINAIDSNPGAAYIMGDNVHEGIVTGAKWIKSNFYDEGYTTIQEMKDGNYATSDTWVRNIVSIANETISYL